MSEPAVSASIRGASYLIILQVLSRGVTFGLNQSVLRYLSPELLGLSAQLELFSITVLYFARESVRVAVQREKDATQKIVNFAYLPILFGAPLALVLGGAYLRTAPEGIAFFGTSLWVYAISCVIELLSEPAFVAAQQKLLFGARASAEGAAALARCFATVAVVVWGSRSGVQTGVLPFAAGQLAFSITITFLYAVQLFPVARKEGFSLTPRTIQRRGDDRDTYMGNLFSKSLSNLTTSLFLQNGFKYILTQGDGILVATLTSLRDQGTYALASNYGGLVARMLFQPIEEITRNLFSRTCATDSATDRVPEASIKQAKSLLQDILRVYGLLSLVAVSLGPFLSPILLRIVAGDKWAETGAGAVLSAYCLYIPFLAINGVTEAFVAAVASSKGLRTQSSFMVVFFAGFAAAAYFFLSVLKLGAIGLVWSNAVNMAMRIVFNVWFIKGYFGGHGQAFALKEVAPTIWSFVLTGGFMMNYGPGKHFPAQPVIQQLPFAALSSALFLIMLAFFEREFVMQSYRRFMPRRAYSAKKTQ